MNKEELEKEAEDKGIKYADSLKMDIKVEDGVEGYAWYQVEQAYEKGALDFTEPREKQIAELEKENAELKEEMNAKQVVLNDFRSRVETVTDRFNRKSSQLTEAKEIIKGLLSFVDSLGNYSGGIFAKAEQFLSEVEK